MRTICNLELAQLDINKYPCVRWVSLRILVSQFVLTTLKLKADILDGQNWTSHPLLNQRSPCARDDAIKA